MVFFISFKNYTEMFLFCLLYANICMMSVLLAHLAKDHVSYCHHLAFVVRRRPSVIRRKRLTTFKSSPLKPLNQIKPNLAGMIRQWVPFKIVSDRSALHSRWLLEIEISSIVHCCFITNLNEIKFQLQLHDTEQFIV